MPAPDAHLPPAPSPARSSGAAAPSGDAAAASAAETPGTEEYPVTSWAHDADAFPLDGEAAPRDDGEVTSWTPDADGFPGCRAVRIPRDELADHEGRIEYWDGATEIAMVCETVSLHHELPSQRLAQMTALIAVARGAPIDTCGTADLLLRNEHGKTWRILEADQTVYLYPVRDRPDGPYMVVGEDTLPNVVVEVDHTTDARRRKLAMYRSWNLPEVWVEVPDAPSPSRPASRKPGLTIHVLHADGYRPSPRSRAFPGWTAAEIHQAMNEPVLSAETMAVLERVGQALRERDGAGPHDTPFLRLMRAASHAEGHAEGRAEGRAEQRALLRRQAARRFDAETAERLAALLADVDDPARLEEAAEWIVACATGAELLDRCSRRPGPVPPAST